jgi:regulator of RNase E activity RraA
MPVIPGDLVVGDPDGVVVVPKARIQEILGKGRAIVEKERKMRQRIQKGELIYDILDLAKLLQREDVVERER